jgi:hypothetical protein
LSKHERDWHLEVVPCFSFNKKMLTLDVFPPEWVERAIRATTGSAPQELEEDAALLWPYFVRITEGDGDVKSGKQPEPDQQQSRLPAWVSKAISIQVRNAHGNLRVIDDPMPENPNDTYLSHLMRSPALRPDFYVLALPLTEASKLLWRAEREGPGRLHGSMAEVLDFDRRSCRRTAQGTPIRLNRDVDGRPPLEYPLRDFAGIQYYFQNQVRIGAGHIYYPRAEWGLSSISQLAYWRERMSPAGPFIGQLSVDIGDFYRRAPARFGNRVMRSAWNSSSSEIAKEVWFQVRQGLDRERAGILVAPSYYHLDHGLSFEHALGRVFRDRVALEIKRPLEASTFTVWVHGRRFSCAASEDPARIANELAIAINSEFPGAVAAEPHPRENKPLRLVLRSTVPEGAALLYVTGGDPGSFEVSFTSGSQTYRYPHIQQAASSDPRKVRDGLFYALVSDPDVPIVAEADRGTGILLLPKGGSELPRIAVRNDHQQLRVIYGARLEVRLEQCHGCLSFVEGETETIGENTTPFLINVPKQWQYRAGLLKPDDLTFEQIILRPREGERIRYRISNRRWVAVGTHMATTTQLTTMESASESARHAVNAILRCLAFSVGTDYNAQGRVFADLAEVWDPEKNELDDLHPLRSLDSQLVAEGLPHVMDILKITDAVDAMPMHGKPSNDPFTNVMHLLSHVADAFDSDWGFAKHTANDLLGLAVERAKDVFDPSGLLREMGQGPAQATERIRELLQRLFTPAGGATPKPGSDSRKP